MNIIDHVAAHQLEDGDQALINDIDPLEDITVTPMDGDIMVKGFSWNTGDIAVYFINPDKEIALWAV